MPEVKITQYTVYPDGYETFANTDKWAWTLTVDQRDPDRDLWAVCRGPYCLNENGEPTVEPRLSSRTDTWLARHRFPLERALAIAQDQVQTLTINGHTAREASARISQQESRHG